MMMILIKGEIIMGGAAKLPFPKRLSEQASTTIITNREQTEQYLLKQSSRTQPNL
jgi:hypothetical protein